MSPYTRTLTAPSACESCWKTSSPLLPFLLTPPHPQWNLTTAIKNCFPSCGVSLPQTDSPAASAGPINGPACALPRRACFPGRPLLAHTAPSARTVGSSCRTNRTRRTDTTHFIMGFSRALVCATAFVLVLLSSASKGWYCYSNLLLFVVLMSEIVVCLLADGRAPFLFVWTAVSALDLKRDF